MNSTVREKKMELKLSQQTADIVSEYYGWAIDTRTKEGHGLRLIGRFWWFGDKAIRIPRHMKGHQPALFETRREAREALPRTRRGFPKSKVIKVSVVIREE